MQESLEGNQYQYGERVKQLREEIDVAHQSAKEGLVTLKIAKKEIAKDDKISMQFNYMPALAKKQEVQVQNQIPFNPFLNPSKQLLIKQLGTTHRLLFNKFNIFQKHLLVVTKEFQKQTDMISREDMFYSALACEALDGVLFFNGGNLSGASQPHKHLQILPREAKQLPILSALRQFVSTLPKGTSQIVKFPHFNYKHGIVAISPIETFEPIGDALYRGYVRLYEELITKNKLKGVNISDYNIVACDSFIFMALRGKQHAFGKISINSVGFMGSLLFKDQALLQEFLKISPSSILESICIKEEETN